MTTTASPIEAVLSDAAVAELAQGLKAGRSVIASGAVGSSTVFVASAVARQLGRPVVLVVAHLDDAESAVDELEMLGSPSIRLPALEVLPGESDAAADLLAERVAAVRAVLALGEGDAPVIVAPIHALMQTVPRPSQVERLSLRLASGDRCKQENLIEWLAAAGYDRRDAIEDPGEFAVRGGIIDVFPTGGATAAPLRLDFFGDEIDRITEIDLETMGSDRRLDRIELVAAKLDPNLSAEGVSFLDLVPDRAVALLAETMEVTEQGRGYFERLTDSRGVFGPPAVFKLLRERFTGFAEVNQFSIGHAAEVGVELPVATLPHFSQTASEAVGELESLAAEGRHIVIACENEGERSRCGELLAEFAPELTGVTTLVGYVHRGFLWRDGLAVVPYHELLHRFQTRRRARRMRGGRAMDTFLEIEPGDYVVHVDHGIAQFTGLRTMSPDRLGKRNAAAPPSKKHK
ncbi:MAG: CarD family transcriptional regulator, partial [Planctomycetota bacterium]